MRLAGEWLGDLMVKSYVAQFLVQSNTAIVVAIASSALVLGLSGVVTAMFGSRACDWMT